MGKGKALRGVPSKVGIISGFFIELTYVSI